MKKLRGLKKVAAYNTPGNTNPNQAIYNTPVSNNIPPAVQPPAAQPVSKPSMAADMGFDALMSGGMNAGVAAITKAPESNLIKSTSQFALRPMNMGAGLATGALSSVPTYFVNKATTSMSNGLANYYSREDNKPSLYHAALIAAPAAAGGMYGLGAITHSLDKGKDILKSKSFKEAGKHLLDSANPIKHINRGAKEIKNSFLDLFSREKVGLGKRTFGAMNLAFLAASAAPALYSYLTKNRAEDKKSRKEQALGYVDDIGNALSTTTASPVGQHLIKRAVYIPVVTPLLRAKEGLSELATAQKKLSQGELMANELKNVHTKLKKGFKSAGYDGLGLATLGGIGYAKHLYDKAQERKLGRYIG